MWQRWLPLPILSASVLITALDTTLLTVSLGELIRDLDTSLANIQWVVTGYSLALAALTLSAGRLSDALGRRRVFTLGASIFAVGSFLASFAGSVGVLIFARCAFEGTGAALMLPAGAALISTTFEASDRAVAFGVWGAMGAIGASLGPLVGGYVTTALSWRWGFRMNGVISLALVGASLVLERDGPRRSSGADWLGSVLGGLGLLLGVLALVEGPRSGWLRQSRSAAVGPLTVGQGSIAIACACLAAGVSLLVAFVFWERRLGKRLAEPLVSISDLGQRQFGSASLLNTIVPAGQAGLLFVLPSFLQPVLKLDALRTGYALLPLVTAVGVTALLGGFLARYWAERTLLCAGLGASCLALMLLWTRLESTADASDLIAPLGLYGAGAGLSMSQLANISMSALPPERSGEAAGVTTTLRQVGSAVGTALVGAMVTASVAASLSRGAGGLIADAADRVELTGAVRRQASAIQFGARVRTAVQLTEADHAAIAERAVEASTAACRRAVLCLLVPFVPMLVVAARLQGGVLGSRVGSTRASSRRPPERCEGSERSS